MMKINSKRYVFSIFCSVLFLITSQHVLANSENETAATKMNEHNHQADKLHNEHNEPTTKPNDHTMDHGDMDHGDMDHGDMDHGDMNKQDNKPSANARDPHAYANDTTLTTGPYSMPEENQLKLADEHKFWAVLGERLEFDDSSNNINYDLQGWYGTTYDRFVIKSEGEIVSGDFAENQTDLLWGHAITPFWDTQLGIRLDSYKQGKNRQWLAFGVQGLAPYWFELDITGYVGEQGHTALTIEAEYELLITQKLIFQPRAELTIYGKDDVENNLGSGFSSSDLGFRLRYEFSRQFAPYLGVEWSNKFGKTADFSDLENNQSRDTKILVGLRFWF